LPVLRWRRRRRRFAGRAAERRCGQSPIACPGEPPRRAAPFASPRRLPDRSPEEGRAARGIVHNGPGRTGRTRVRPAEGFGGGADRRSPPSQSVGRDSRWLLRANGRPGSDRCTAPAGAGAAGGRTDRVRRAFDGRASRRSDAPRGPHRRVSTPSPAGPTTGRRNATRRGRKTAEEQDGWRRWRTRASPRGDDPPRAILHERAWRCRHGRSGSIIVPPAAGCRVVAAHSSQAGRDTPPAGSRVTGPEDPLRRSVASSTWTTGRTSQEVLVRRPPGPRPEDRPAAFFGHLDPRRLRQLDDGFARDPGESSGGRRRRQENDPSPPGRHCSPSLRSGGHPRPEGPPRTRHDPAPRGAPGRIQTRDRLEGGIRVRPGDLPAARIRTRTPSAYRLLSVPGTGPRRPPRSGARFAST